MKFTKKMSGVLVAGILLAAMTAGCGGGGGDKKAADNKGAEALIGANYELTGNVASYGQSALSGCKMAVDEINKAGGVNGKKLRIVEADNKSEPSESGNAATKLVTQNKLIGFVGPATSGCTMAAEPIVTANKLPSVAPTATADAITFVRSAVCLTRKRWRNCFNSFSNELCLMGQAFFEHIKWNL